MSESSSSCDEQQKRTSSDSLPVKENKRKVPDQTFLYRLVEGFYRSIVGLLIFLIKIYDNIVGPFRCLTERPSSQQRLKRARRIRAIRENLADPGSSYFRIGEHKVWHLSGVKTIPEAQQEAFKMFPNRLALGYREVLSIKNEYSAREKKIMKKYLLSDYKWLTSAQVNQTIEDLEKSLYCLGVRPKERVLIFSETRIEWFLCAQAIFRLGCAVVTLYSSLGEESVSLGIEETGVQVIITSEDLAERLPTELPNVRTVIYFAVTGSSKPKIFMKKMASANDKQVLSYEQLLEKKNIVDDKTKPVIVIDEQDPAVILYSSGSTGKPKGVVLTHKNFITSVKAVLTVFTQEVIDQSERHCWFGYLPLAHILEFIAETAIFCVGIKIGYGTPYTMTDYSTGVYKGQPGDMTLLKPTIVPGVPLVLERIRKGIMEKIDKNPNWPSFVKILTLRLAEYKNQCIEQCIETPILNKLFCHRFRKPLGGQIEYMLIGGAPLSVETQKLMRSLMNVKILIGFGSTETCGANMVMDLDDTTLGYTGAPLFGVKVRLENWPEGNYLVSDKPNPRGELHIGGGVVANGYHLQDQLSKEAFYEVDGVRWFRTGDIAEINEYGMLRIIDRKKDLVKLQHGEYVALGKIEAELKNFFLVDNVCAYADSHHSFVICLIMPNWTQMKKFSLEYLEHREKQKQTVDSKNSTTTTETANNHHPKTTISTPPNCSPLINRFEVENFCQREDFIQMIEHRLFEFCTKETKLSRIEIPRRVIVCREEWTTDNDLITAAMKIKRHNINQFYAKKIQEIYQNFTN